MCARAHSLSLYRVSYSCTNTVYIHYAYALLSHTSQCICIYTTHIRLYTYAYTLCSIYLYVCLLRSQSRHATFNYIVQKIFKFYVCIYICILHDSRHKMNKTGKGSWDGRWDNREKIPVLTNRWAIEDVVHSPLNTPTFRLNKSKSYSFFL